MPLVLLMLPLSLVLPVGSKRVMKRNHQKRAHQRLGTMKEEPVQKVDEFNLTVHNGSERLQVAPISTNVSEVNESSEVKLHGQQENKSLPFKRERNVLLQLHQTEEAARKLAGSASLRVQGIEGIAKLFMCLSAIVLAFFSLCGLGKVVKNFNIRECCCCCGDFLRTIGYDEFDAFSLSIIVHNVELTDDFPQAVRITCGDTVVTTTHSSPKKGIQQTLNLEIPQGSRSIKVALIEGDKMVLAMKKLSIEQVIKLSNDRQKQTLILTKKHSKINVNPRISLTVLRQEDGSWEDNDPSNDLLAGVDEDTLSPEMLMMLHQANTHKHKANRGGEGDPPDVESGGHHADGEQGKVDDQELLATACQGPLRKTESGGIKKDFYFAVYQGDAEGKPHRYHMGTKHYLLAWNLGWWEDEKDYQDKDKPVSYISMLRVTNVYVLHEKKNEFCIRYVDKHKMKQELFLHRVDRSREVWVESLHLFIKQLLKLRKDES